MLFLGLGTGLGSALVWESILMPLELGDLPYPDGHIIENYVGIPGVELLGRALSDRLEGRDPGREETLGSEETLE